MKKSKKLLSLVMGATMLTTSLLAGGCAKGSIYTEGAIEGRPNYDISENAETFKIWSYGQTCDDHYYINSEPIYFLDEYGNPTTMQTRERTQELKDANFTVVFIDYSHSGDGIYMTPEEWEQKPLKRTLDYCQELGLKAFSHGNYLNAYSRGHEMKDENGNYYTSRINPEIYQQQYADTVKTIGATYKGTIYDKYLAIEEETGEIRTAVVATIVNESILEAVKKYYTDIATEMAKDQTFANDEEKTAWIEAKVAELAPSLATEYEALFEELFVEPSAEASLMEKLIADAETKEFADDAEKQAWIDEEFAKVVNDEVAYAELVATEKQTMIDDLVKEKETAINTQVTNRLNALTQEEYDETIESEVELHLWNGAQKKFFKDEAQYVKFAAITMSNVIHHPAFYGSSAIDEPPYYTFPIAAEAMRIWKKAALEYYGKEYYHTMFNMLPAADTPGIKDSFMEKGSEKDVWTAYEAFLEHYKVNFVDTGILDYIQYDDYPIYNTGLRDTYLRCHQLTAEFARDNNIDQYIAMQSYGSDGQHRFNDYEDVLWQAHTSMAFGKTEFSYYTWWPVLNTKDGLLEDRTYPLTRFGERTELYYSIQKVNAELQYNGKYLLHFRYNDSTYVYKTPMPTGIASLNGLRRPEPTEEDPLAYTKLGSVVIDEEALYFKGQAGGAVIVSELYDEENDRYGYYVVNATDPIVNSEAVVTLSFPNFDNIQIVQSMTTSNIALAEHTFTFELGTGRGAFIMPY